jgi:hypothetical protein
MRPGGFTPTILYLLGGLIVWAARFLFIYSFTALACARGLADASLFGFGIVPAVNVLAASIGVAICLTLIATAVARLRLIQADEEDGSARFIHILAALVAGIAIVAMFWETIPVLFIPACAG